MSSSLANCQNSDNTLYPKDPLTFSEDLFLSIRTEQDYSAYVDTLERIDLDRLETDLNSHDKKVAFWINTYNSLVQIKARSNPSAFEDQDAFFKSTDILFGTTYVSLDQIENGIMRRKAQGSESSFIERFEFDKVEPRIHFTLNCGATSCPPIAYYDYSKLDEQLSTAEAYFVKSNSSYSPTSNTLTTSEIFKWFEDDFGGREGVIALMKKYNVISSTITPVIKYTPYDWNLNLNNY